MNKKTNTQGMRYACQNWDPVVRVKYHGHTIGRKVETIGEVNVTTGKMSFVIEKLRQGYDVTIDGVLLLKPMMKPDLSGMYVSARTAHALYACLDDKVANVVHRGETIDESGRREMVENTGAYREARRVQVTPDIDVTCPKCGYEFRVGRKIAA